MEESRRETLIVGALCVAWYCASSASNVVGKLVLTRFPFPMTVTMVQLLATVLLSPPAFYAAGVRRAVELPRRYWGRVLVPLAFAKFLTTVFSQVSIWKVPVSYAHTVKATTPLWTAALAYVLFGERQPARVRWALVLIAGGVGLASLTERGFHAAGLAAALASAALLSLQHIYSKRALRDSGLHHLRLLLTLSRLALALFLPLWAWSDLPALLGGAGAEAEAGTGALLLADGALAWLQAVLAFSVLSRVTPLGYAVASAAKRVAVVGASLVALRNPASPLNLAGMALAAAGVLAYHRAKASAPRRAGASAAADSKTEFDKNMMENNMEEIKRLIKAKISS